MRTQREILDRVKMGDKEDPLGFVTGPLIEALDYDHATEFLKEGVTKEDWDADRPSARDRLVDYIAFAIDKAENGRGISAYRSRVKLGIWCWIIGDDKGQARMAGNYDDYGLADLRWMRERYPLKRLECWGCGDGCDPDSPNDVRCYTCRTGDGGPYISAADAKAKVTT